MLAGAVGWSQWRGLTGAFQPGANRDGESREAAVPVSVRQETETQRLRTATDPDVALSARFRFFENVKRAPDNGSARLEVAFVDFLQDTAPASYRTLRPGTGRRIGGWMDVIAVAWRPVLS
jgi:hypothetical protein